LIHDYTTDDKGMLTKVNLIVGTTHNNGPINMSVKQAATSLITNGNYDEGILNKVEMAIRAYEPCMSCSTQNMDGSIAVQVEIVEYKGNILDRYKN